MRWLMSLRARLNAWRQSELKKDRRTTAQIFAEMHRRDIRALLDGSAMEALSLRRQKPVSSEVVLARMFARVEAQDAPVLRTAQKMPVTHRRKQVPPQLLNRLSAGQGDGTGNDLEIDPFSTGTLGVSTLEYLDTSTDVVEGDSLDADLMRRADLSGTEGILSDQVALMKGGFDDEGIEIASDNLFSGGINPASGLPMISDSSIDVAGNPYGIDLQDHGGADMF